MGRRNDFNTSNVAAEPDVAAAAALLGDATRAAMCLSLLDGRAMPAGELARRARVSPQTASNHLDRLLRGNILAVEQQGRWRYYRLAGEAVAGAVEALAVIAPPTRVAVARSATIPDPLRQARTCYSHFAGVLGVRFADALVTAKWITPDDRAYRVTPAGAVGFGDVGIDVTALRPVRGAIARRCLDWSERRHHLAGPLATALMHLSFQRDWVRRLPGTRAVLVTPRGRGELRRLFGIDPSLGDA